MLHKVIDYICHRFALIYAFGSFAFIPLMLRIISDSFPNVNIFIQNLTNTKTAVVSLETAAVFEIKKSAGLCARYLTYKITVALTNSSLYFAKSTFSEVSYGAFFIASGSPGVRCQNAETLNLR